MSGNQPAVYKLILISLFVGFATVLSQEAELRLNELDYFDMPGLSVMVFNEDYPEGHQGGITIIQHGVRVAANGDVRLEPAPGQWQPVPKVGERKVDRKEGEISVRCAFPNPDKHRKGFNPIVYPDLELDYTVNVRAEGQSLSISVDLDKPLPQEWVGKAGFNLELFPGDLFGRTYLMDGSPGFFPRQLNGPVINDEMNGWINKPLAMGRQLVVAPEDDSRRMTIRSNHGELELIDGRMYHNNGWFIVRTVLPAGKTKQAVEWLVSPHVISGWKCKPVIHVSQVGYLPGQQKIAVIETDRSQNTEIKATLQKISDTGNHETVREKLPMDKGTFYRNRYFHFDFSNISEPGIYVVTYGDQYSNPFIIGKEIFGRHVWQPALEYFLPVQMCHMRVNDRYRVWHGLCHMDDALMAPTDTLHFDGYYQGASTLSPYQPYEHVTGLNVGGWHDAGDYDLRVESQAQTVRTLALAYETFGLDYDQTTVDQETRVVELHQPDGKPDALQQIEHGVLSILAGYSALGRLYRGIICSDQRQYVLLGDGSTMTDNRTYTGKDPAKEADDRWVFTEENPYRELHVAASLATAYRSLKEYDGEMADELLKLQRSYGEKTNIWNDLLL